MEGRFIRSFNFLLLLCAFAITSFAQTTRGSIAGVITDSSGAVISNATVTVTPEAGGEARSITTGSNGEYRVESLNPGLYRVEAAAQGFSKKTVEHVAVRTSQVTSNNLALQVGSSTDTVTVEAGADQIQTETGELSKTIPVQEIKDLPYVSLNPYSLAITLPGVAKVAGRDDLTNGTSFSVNGLRPRSNNFLIDGFDNNDNGIGGQAFQPNNVESVQEVTVLTNAYQAEFGRGGGSVSNLSYRSGSNQFHGAVWEQYAGSALNAVSSEESQFGGLTRPSQTVNNVFGFRVGGPIVKNKLFFFGTSQWNRLFGSQAADTLEVPTAAGLATLQAIAAGGNSNAALMARQVGSTIGVSNPFNVAVGQRPGCPAPCNVEFASETRTDVGKSLGREWTARVDFNPTSSDSFYVRYTDSQGSLTPDLFANSGSLPSEDTQQGGPSRIFGALWTHTFSPRVLNEFRFSGQQIDFDFAPTAATANSPDAILPSIFFQNTTGAFFGGFGQGVFPQGRGHKVYQFQDAVSLMVGSHNLKLGADLAVLNVSDRVPFNGNGSVTIHAGGDCSALLIGTCTELANFLDGFSGPSTSNNLTKAFGSQRISVPTNQQAYYVQDAWKAKSNLTLTYGVRYEYQPPDASNVLNFPAVDPTKFATEPFFTRHVQEPDRNNFGGRFGFSYSPSFWQSVLGNNRTVIRGGWGMFYDAFFSNISDNTAATSPNAVSFATRSNVGRGLAFIPTIAAATATPSPLGTRQSVVNNLQNPLTHQWNLNVQRELPWKMAAEVAYVGTRGERLWVNQQLNPLTSAGTRLVPTLGSTVVRSNKGDSIYHGLQTQISRNVGRVAFRGSYTWSKSLDNQSEVFATQNASRWQNVFDPRSDRGPSVFDRRHVAALSYTVQLWDFKDRNAFLRQVVGGWETSGIAQWQTGAPETVFSGYDQNGDGEATNDRPNLSNPNAALNYTDACFSDPTCITGYGFDDGSGTIVDFNTGAPGTADQFRYISVFGTNGNVSRNSYRYPGIWSFDMSLFKRFPLPYGEGHHLELRADAFNLFNHPNLGVSGLSGNLASPSFAPAQLFLTRRGGRTMQIRLKYEF
jgi:hypothetical protein